MIEAAPPAILYWGPIDDSGSPGSIRPECFRRQMETIARKGMNAVGLTGIPATERTLSLTFDGSARTFVENVLPVMEEYGYPCTLFVASGHCSAGGRYLHWDELRKLPAVE